MGGRKVDLKVAKLAFEKVVKLAGERVELKENWKAVLKAESKVGEKVDL